MNRRLLTPGPTSLPPQVRIAAAKEIIHHRSDEFLKVFQEVREGLKSIFQTRNEVLIFTCSGTGVMEAVIVNLLSPKDKILVIKGGKFGERWADIGASFGLQVTGIDVEWGRVVDPNLIEKELSRDSQIKAVFTQLVETSTGVVYDIKSIARIVKETEAVLVVDAISGLGGEYLPADEWGVDVVVGASQKALMAPPGLAFVSLSDKAWKLVEESTLPRYYWNFKEALRMQKNNQTPFTPAVSLICALRESLKLIKEKGEDNILKHHARLAEATRKGVLALGLKIFSEAPSNIVTAIELPLGIEDKKLRALMRDRYGVEITGGQGKLKGKIIRIAHLGWVDALDIMAGISSLEMALSQMGFKVNLGEGVKAAEKVLSGSEE
ncbi:alanine--glyoxylate aminotransferase family protein [Candidatus Aerophobetes bacterium]|nr:alanine--glyoxylate aminotransferase family protein [Candidatus Aerophobetes bacterium]